MVVDVEDSGLKILGNFSSEKLTLPQITARYLKVDYVDPQYKDNALPTSANHAQTSMQFPFAATPIHKFRIKEVKYLVTGEIDVKRIIELTLDCSMISIDFLPGDTIGILPENRDEDIEIVLTALNLLDRADDTIKVLLHPQTTKKSAKIPSYIPLSSTPRILFKECLNINSIPKKLFLRLLVDCTVDEEEKNFLKVLCSKEGNKIYSKIIIEENTTFVKLLKMCPSCHPDIEVILEHLPRLLPRQYSIKNSPLESNKELKIIFSILGSNPGITTSYLEKLICNKFILENENEMQPYVNGYLRQHNKFRYTDNDIMESVIMISVGCGISPFLGFMKHKERLCMNTKYSNAGDMWLITGYRYRKCSLYYDQIIDYLKKGIISKHFESYSREPDCKFKYVQNHIIENFREFGDKIFKENARIYVCADGKNISKDIQEAIITVIKNALHCGMKEAKEMLVQLQENGRYIEDIWT